MNKLLSNDGVFDQLPSINIINPWQNPKSGLNSRLNLTKRRGAWASVMKLRYLLRIATAKMIAAMLAAAPAFAQSVYADPAGSGALVGAVNWLQSTLLGTVATAAAVIAIASVGFLMLTGRMNWRYGITVIIGCFILFGAGSIVAGIQQTAAVGY
jgi:type IV secretion system protein VirB2